MHHEQSRAEQSRAEQSRAEQSRAEQSRAEQRNYAVDTLKFFCALLVVLIHCSPSWTRYFDPIKRLAVPCFFMISGYFLYVDNSQKFQERLLRTLKRICIITFWSSCLYFILALCLNYSNFIEDISSVKSWANLLLFNEFVLSWPFGSQLWYLFAYIYVLSILYLCSKYRVLKYLYFVIPILLLISVVFGRYLYVCFDESFVTRLPSFIANDCHFGIRNFLFAGIPYVMIGMFIKSKAHIFLNPMNKRYIWAGLALSVIIMLCEYSNGLIFRGDYYLCTAPLAISVLLIILTTKQTKDNIISRIGREDSLYIYIFHMAIMIVIAMTLNKMVVDNLVGSYDSLYTLYYKLIQPLLIFTLSVAASIAFRSIKSYVSNRWELWHNKRV